MAPREVRRTRHGLFIFHHRFDGATALQERGGEIEAGFYISRVAGKNPPEFLDRVREISPFKKSQAEIAVSNEKPAEILRAAWEPPRSASSTRPLLNHTFPQIVVGNGACSSSPPGYAAKAIRCFASSGPWW